MVFSSTLFLFLFLPVVLTGHLLLPARLRNAFLLAASLVFYAWGEPSFVLVMLGSIAVNHALGLAVQGSRTARARQGCVALAVALNLGVLGFYKYASFLVRNANRLLEPAGVAPFPVPAIALPIGISFFTFQALSYVIDVHRGDTEVQRNPFRTALYVSLFPQLIAGPIVRYRDVAAQIASRSVDASDFAQGVRRFVVGLAKKVLVANTVSLPADRIFALPASDLTQALAWLAVACYTVQIYFDFSGYSDMAIGMGRMLGFRFLENFRWPYAAPSVREFWRRWHISLSTWFRDYLYVPLGGSRGSAARTHANLVTVFFLCGLWHGAAWTFAAWGLWHGAFLVLERTRVGQVLGRLPRPLRHAYTLLVVMLGWVLFRAESFPAASSMLGAMLGNAPSSVLEHPLRRYLTNDVALALAAGIVGSVPLEPAVARWHERLRDDVRGLRGVAASALSVVTVLLLLLASAAVLSGQTHNPFIYFRF